MSNVTLGFAAALIATGVIAFVATGMEHLTALIPSAAGAVLGALGLAARKQSWRRHAMHGAAVVATLGMLATAPGIPKALRLLAGGTLERPAAAVTQAVMAVLCAVFLGLCVQSFVAARRNRGG